MCAGITLLLPCAQAVQPAAQSSLDGAQVGSLGCAEAGLAAVGERARERVARLGMAAVLAEGLHVGRVGCGWAAWGARGRER